MMIEFNKIWANARFEIITLLRGWFFRIFAGLSIVLFLFINIVFFSTALPVPRIFRALASSVPYANMVLLNIAQMVIIIFMASDFFKRDRKLNTSEVFHIRSMTNASYVLGKSLAILILFFVLDIFILVIAFVIHTLFSDVTLNISTYLYYPLLINFPSFIFMIGLSFLMMRVIKNQAVVVLILLGYFALTMLYLAEQYYYIFDFYTLFLPLIHSDFVGFANLENILLQRGMYSAVGIMLILVTIIFFNRLPQSKIVLRISVILTGFLLIFSIWCGYKYLTSHSDEMDLRMAMKDLNRQNINQPNLAAIDYKIDLRHKNNSLEGITTITVKNSHNQNLDRMYLSINPGLHVEKILLGKELTHFKQTNHLLDLKIEPGFPPGFTDTLKIYYSGQIDQAVCYLDITDEMRDDQFNIWLYKIPKRYALVTSDYVILPSEALWYPRAGLPPGAGFPDQMNVPFARFQLEVHTSKNLSVLAQGKCDTLAPGHFNFSPENALQNISLVIGAYKEQYVVADSICYSLYTLPGHNYYEAFFSAIGDTVGEILTEMKQDYEVRLDLEYPFKRISLIEVPIQYYTYPRIWTVTEEVTQSEQIWIHENGASVYTTDFNQMNRRLERSLDRSNQTFSETESQVNLLKSFLSSTFLGTDTRLIRFGGPEIAYKPNYNLFALFYSNVFYISAGKWQIFNSALEAFLFDRVSSLEDDTPPWLVEGLTKAEKATISLREKSLADQLRIPDVDQNLPDLIKLKGSFLIKLIQNELGSESFNRNLRSAINTRKFQTIKIDTFLADLNLLNKFNFYEYIGNWYNSTEVPAFNIYNVDLFKVMDRNRIRSQIIFTVYNPESTPGLLEITFRYSRRGRGFSLTSAGSEDPPRIYRVNPGVTKKIGILLDDEPRAVNINFLLAKNLPLIYTKNFEDAELDESKIAFEGELLLDRAPDFSAPGEIIIDNEDKGFLVYNPPYTSVLKQMIHSEETEQEKSYQRYEWWSPPHQWTAIKNAAFFGRFIHSAHYIQAGDGQKYVSWTTELDSPGLYDIYIYMFSKEGFWRGRRRNRSINFGDMNFKIYHESGTEDVVISAEDAPEGWNFLGTWYLPKGQAKVTLSDKSNANMVIADAIKLVKN